MTSLIQFSDILKENNDLVIFLFTADWCNSCKKIKLLIPYNKYNIYDIVVDDLFKIYAKLRF